MTSQARRQLTHSGPIPLKIVSVEGLLELNHKLHNLIARRAYEIFEKRGWQHGRDFDDWLQAESEILHSCRHQITEHPDSLVLRGQLPGNFTPDQIKLSIEPRRVIVSGEKPVSSLYLEGATTQTRPSTRRIFRIHELPAEVDPQRSKATLNGEELEIKMPKLKITAEQVKTEKTGSQAA